MVIHSTSILISFLDIRDPGLESPLQALCRQITPQVVYLLPCAPTEAPGSALSQEAAEAMREWLHTAYSPSLPVYIRPINAADPTSFTDMLAASKQTLLTIIRHWQQHPTQFHLNTSSGSEAMKGVLLLLCEAGLIPNATLWQAQPVNNHPSHLKLSRLQPTLLSEETSLEQLRPLAEEMRFAELARECQHIKSVTLCADCSRAAGLMTEIFQAYHYWDAMQYAEASRLLRSLCYKLSDIPEAELPAEILSKQFLFLVRLLTNEEMYNLDYLTELAFGCERCFLRGDYQGTFLRFRRFYQGLCTYLLQQARQEIPAALHDIEQAVLSLTEMPGRDFSLFWNVHLESCLLGDRVPAGHIVAALHELYQRSFLGQGMQPLLKTESADALLVVQEMARYFLPASDYPLQRDTLDKLLPFLQQPGVTAALTF